MAVQLEIDNKTTDHFKITATFDLDDLRKVGPCIDEGAPADAEGDALIAFMFKQWCDHRASDWFEELAKAARRVEQFEAAQSLDGEVIGPVLQVDEV